MDTLDFNGKLDFSEFSPTSTEEWEAVIEKDLKGQDYKKVLSWNPENNLEVLPFYRSEHLEQLAHTAKPVRAHAGWTSIQSILVDDLRSANQTALNALQNGASGLYFYGEPNHLSTTSDIERLLKDIQIELISLAFGPAFNSESFINELKLYIQSSGLDPKTLDIIVSHDPFSSGVFTGKLASKKAIEQYFSAFPFALNIDISGYGNAGATIVQQCAFALAAGNEILGIAGKNIPLNFNFAVASNYFPEMAKFRAFRLMWNQVLETYQIEPPKPSLYAQTALWNKTQNDAHNNMLRATTEAMSAVLSGADALTILPYNVHFDKASEFSNRISRNVQLILQEEAYFDKVSDPGAGSYYVEALTDKVAVESWDLFQKIEKKGGFYACLKSGFIQNQITHSRESKIESYKERKEILVGVNKYQPDEITHDLSFSTQHFLSKFESDHIEIEKIVPLNMEAELQKGDA
ncbi:MAG: methylmalonyl-CoA mutase subunit beta [Gracilimonas sp.]|nr:methylmalonyl-CoA mutase subunit beta [Gracilimonas sp.]